MGGTDERNETGGREDCRDSVGRFLLAIRTSFSARRVKSDLAAFCDAESGGLKITDKNEKERQRQRDRECRS